MGAYCTSAAALPENPMPIHHANGIFEVTITPQEQSQAASAGLPSASYRLEKIFSGPLAKDGSTELDIAIATDSGSGQLAGIAGSLKIDVREGKHYYELTYTLP